VPKVAEEPNLSQHLLGLVRVVEDLGDPLDRHRLARRHLRAGEAGTGELAKPLAAAAGGGAV